MFPPLIARGARSILATVKGSCRRGLSSATAVEIPTRHSLKQPPRVCSDPVELQEETLRLLETPVGKLYASKATATGGVDEAYELAYGTIQRAEYLQFGHASQIAGSLYALVDSISSKVSEDPISASMKPLLERMQKEGEMYMQLRHEKRAISSDDSATFMPGSYEGGFSTDEEGYLASSEDDSDSSSDESSGSSSSDDDSDDDSDTASMASKRSKVLRDFAPPGPTSKMQEALLDAMACVGQASPLEYYDVAVTVLKANDLDKGKNLNTLPSHVTYNAALRGIAKCDIADEQTRDEALSSAFTLYNHLTHSLHLPRNNMTFVYMLQVIDKAFPACRVKGNISATLWDHASRLGVANEEVIAAMRQVHDPTNGPEFDILLEEFSSSLPQKYRRFISKYRHSDNY